MMPYSPYNSLFHYYFTIMRIKYILFFIKSSSLCFAIIFRWVEQR